MKPYSRSIFVSSFANFKVRIYVIGYRNIGESIVVFMIDDNKGVDKVVFSMIIDCYKKGDLNIAMDLLKKHGVSELDFAIWTHPHDVHSPGFDEIIYGDVSNPLFESVIVAKSDRVARDIEVYYYYKMLLRKKEISLISITEDFGKFGVFSDMLESFTLCVAKMERENINKRTSAGRSIKAAQGGYSGGRTPFGYKAENHKMVIVPAEAEIVKTVFRMKDDEGKTYKAVCDYLNSKGLVNRSGTKFSISTIQVIYENKKVYQGFYKYGKQSDYVKGVHEPILKPEE